jgi:hypothetical protein
MVATMVMTVGLVGSSLYVLQIVAQIRIYGFRRWVEFGMGTGVEIHPQAAEADDET